MRPWALGLVLLAGCTTSPLPAPSGGVYVGVCQSQYEGRPTDHGFVYSVDVEERFGPIFHCKVKVHHGESGGWEATDVHGFGPLGHIQWTSD